MYRGLLRNKFHSSNRYNICNLLRNLLATEKQREEALDVDDLSCYNFPNFGPESFCIGQKEVPKTTVTALGYKCRNKD